MGRKQPSWTGSQLDLQAWCPGAWMGLVTGRKREGDRHGVWSLRHGPRPLSPEGHCLALRVRLINNLGGTQSNSLEAPCVLSPPQRSEPRQPAPEGPDISVHGSLVSFGASSSGPPPPGFHGSTPLPLPQKDASGEEGGSQSTDPLLRS